VSATAKKFKLKIHKEEEHYISRHMSAAAVSILCFKTKDSVLKA
jgi:hypothetical protein